MEILETFLLVFCLPKSRINENGGKSQVNKAMSSFLFTLTVCIFILLLGGDTKGFLVSLQTIIFDGLNQAVQGTLEYKFLEQHLVLVSSFLIFSPSISYL